MADVLKFFAVAMLLAVFTWSASATAGKLYRWVDENGTVHFGDRVPPEYSKGDRQVLNEHGVTVDTLEKEPSEEEILAEQRELAAAETERVKAEELMHRDSVLLNTYLSIDEIEALRDRRKELLNGRIQVTENYLSTLRKKLIKLQKDASRFQPYNSDPKAPPIHDWLAKELANTLDSILVNEQTLIMTRNQQTETVRKFDDDIGRFKELKGLE
jgi:hypothetical protein